MIQIEIKVPRRLFSPGWPSPRWTKQYHRKFAENINELSKEQLLSYCRVVAQQHPSQGALKIRLLAALYELPMLLLYSMSRVQLAQLTLYLNPLLENVRLTRQLLPKLEMKTVWHSWIFFAPGGSFVHLRMGEFMVAHAYFIAYHQSGEMQHLDLLVATIYREKCPRGNGHRGNGHALTYGDKKREPFNPDKLSDRAQKMAGLPVETKLAVYYYFAGCFAELTEMYDEVFSGGEQKGSTGAVSTGDWIDVVRSLPNDKLGTMDEIEQLFVHVVFDLMNRMMKDQKKLNHKK